MSRISGCNLITFVYEIEKEGLNICFHSENPEMMNFTFQQNLPICKVKVKLQYNVSNWC